MNTRPIVQCSTCAYCVPRTPPTASEPAYHCRLRDERTRPRDRCSEWAPANRGKPRC